MRKFVSKHSVGLIILLSIFVIGAGTNQIWNGKLMSFLDANNFPLVNIFNQTPKEIWISFDRTDGKGKGTQADPFDGSTKTKFDALLTAIAANTHIHLGPTTSSVPFQVTGLNPTVASNLKAGQWLQGSGMYDTTVQMQGNLAGGASLQAFTTPLAGADNVTVSDLTIDCNYGGLSNSADNGATVRTVSDGVTNSTATVTSATLALTANDLGSVVTGSSDFPVNTYVGIINSGTSFGLSSSAVSNVPISATGTHSGQTITLKEKNIAINAISLRGSNQTIRSVRCINGFGSWANSEEMFLANIVAATNQASVNNLIENCRFETPWGNYGTPVALFGYDSTHLLATSKVVGCHAFGRNSGLNSGFTTGGVNLAANKDITLIGNIWTDCSYAAYHDTGSLDGLRIIGDQVIRGGGGVGLASVTTPQQNIELFDCKFSVQSRANTGTFIILVNTATTNFKIYNSTIVKDSTGLGGYPVYNITDNGGLITNPTFIGNTIDNMDGQSYASTGGLLVSNRTTTGAAVTGIGDNISISTTGTIQSTYEKWGSGSPEGAVTAPVGAIYHRTNGGAGTSFYVKETGSGNTGWAAK